MEKEPVIKVRNLTVQFGDNLVLDNISFDVNRSEIFVILGGSGCGKTTLLRHLLGLRKPQGGHIYYNDVDIVDASEKELEDVQRGFGVLFQSGALLKSMTLGENVALPLKESTNLSDELIDELVKLKLSMVALGGKEDLMPSELSGGMQKRGGLARAIALDPEILFFDEPSAGLDPITSAELDNLIIKMNATLKTTMIVVTHELQSIYAIAQRAIMLDRESHSIIAEGKPTEMRDTSDHPLVKAFFLREAVHT